MTPKAHFFDMDHTLINADCDVTWKDYLVASAQAPASDLDIAAQFFDDYNHGCLDFEKFMLFQLKEFIGHTREEMQVKCREHFERFIKPVIYPAALELIRQLKQDNLPVYILTATNCEIARPVAEYFGVDACLGTTLEEVDGRFTGRIAGVYAAQEGKITIAREYASAHHWTLADVAYYGDSINDRPVLAAVGHPFAVNPSPALLSIAREKHWPILQF